MAAQQVIVAAAERPHPRESVSGDAWVAHWHNGVCRLTVIDGLGHGPLAAAAAEAALVALAAKPEAGPEVALRACHHALAGTRGAVAAVAQIDPIAGKLMYAGVGNVEGRLWQAGQEKRLVSYRGILGAMLPTVHLFTFDLEPDWLLILHTDGISARFELAAVPELAGRKPRLLARALLDRCGRHSDDATVVVACGATAPAPPPRQ